MKCTDCNRVIKPVVAIDIDGTLGDYHRHFVRFAESYFGMHLPDTWNGMGEWEQHLGLTKHEYREVKLAYRQGGQKRSMPVFQNALAGMDAIRETNAELWLTTTRPWNRLDSVDPDTREWLRRNSIPYDHLLYDDDKYARLAEIVGAERVIAVVDDLYDECLNAQRAFGNHVPIQVSNNFNTDSIWPIWNGRKHLADALAEVKRRVLAWQS